MKKPLFFLILFLGLNVNLWAMARRPPQKKQPEPKPVTLSLTLMDAYQLALKRSETLAIKKEEVARTLAGFLEASGEAVGDFDFEITDSRQDPQKAVTSSSSTSNSLRAETRERVFVYSQPLFQGFKAVGALTGAGSLKKQRQGEWRRAKQLLFVDVVNSFYEYLKLQKDIEIIQGILHLFDDRIKDLKAWEDIGRTRPSEVASARSRAEVFNADLAKSKGDLAVAKNLLAFLVGMVLGPEELIDEKTPTAADENLNIFERVQKRPDVEASRQAVKTARSNLMIAQSELWPTITLDGDIYDHREGTQSGISWDTLVTFKVPLGKGGTTIGKVRDALSQWREAKFTRSLTERTAEREIRDAFDNWKTAADRYQALEKALEASQENFTLQSKEYQRRLVSNLDVLEALQSLFETKRDANEAFYDMKKNYWRLEVAKGNCCS